MKTKAKATYTAKVVLHMSMDDAKVLRRVLSFVGGAPDGRRGAVDRIDAALKCHVPLVNYAVEEGRDGLCFVD